MPEKKLSLVARLHAITQEFQVVEKKGRNERQSYDFVKAGDIIEATRKMLFKHDVYNSVTELQLMRKPETTPKGGIMFHTQLKMKATFYAVDNPSDSIEVEFYGVGADPGDKDIYKAKTGGLKYLYQTMFKIPTELDDPENEWNDNSTGDFF